jgi:hypothetical protein
MGGPYQESWKHPTGGDVAPYRDSVGEIDVPGQDWPALELGLVM